MKSGGIGGGGGSQNKDPFGGLVDFSAKGSGGMKTGSKTNVGSKTSVPAVSGVMCLVVFKMRRKVVEMVLLVWVQVRVLSRRLMRYGKSGVGSVIVYGFRHGFELYI